jgi:HEAT repeat protein
VSQQTASEPKVDPPIVEELLQTLSKGLRVLQMYLPNNPIYQQALNNIREGFRPVWDSMDELSLEVTETEFQWEEEVVYENPERSESLAWMVFKDGVRSLKLFPGVEGEEIIEFLSIVHKARTLPAGAEDDLLTLLWEADFQKIQYEAQELAEEGVPRLEKSTAPPPPPPKPLAAPTEEAPAVVSLDDTEAPSLFVLTEEDLEYLDREVRREYEQDLPSNVVAVLYDIYESQPGTDTRQEVTSTLEMLVSHFVAKGDFPTVACLFADLAVVPEQAEGLTAEQRQALEVVPRALSQPETITQLLEAINAADEAPTDEQLQQLFGQLQPAAVPPGLDRLHGLHNELVRRRLHQAILRVVQANPSAVVPVLRDQQSTGLIEGIRLGKLLKLQLVLPELASLLDHPDGKVRLEATQALVEIGTPDAMAYLEKALGDERREVRVAAVRGLGTHGHQGALARIEALLSDNALKGADLIEKKARFEAFGLLVGPPGIEKLVAMLRPKGFLKRKADGEMRACAAMALGKIATPEVRAFLEEAKDDRDPLVRNAIQQALREKK